MFVLTLSDHCYFDPKSNNTKSSTQTEHSQTKVWQQKNNNG